MDSEFIEDSASAAEAVELTEQQKKRIESNKEKAIALRKQRIHQKPYERPSTSGYISNSPTKPSAHVTPTASRPAASSQWDTYGGYILEDDQPQHGYGGRVVEDEGEFPS